LFHFSFPEAAGIAPVAKNARFMPHSLQKIAIKTATYIKRTLKK